MTTLEQAIASVRSAGAAGQCFDDATKDLVLIDIAEELGMRSGALLRALQKAHAEGLEVYRLASWEIRYTTAPADYDWMGTERLGVAGYDKTDRKPWYKIRVNPDYVETQTDRYMSGMKPCVAQAEFDKLIAYELVVKA